ncbi:MAG TPA: S-methyl-5-thioribose-1-phosphate isomerase [Proteobacteria bacterium]|nr:methylthioribose-1-phosphate isomerase [bacterium BMS3Abin14]HDL52772.1 S-methyl-5-thioribose-1-phosphate isomerase [Pseudomonadota bacterium]
MPEIRPIRWDAERKLLMLLDQTKLPLEETYVEYADPAAVAEAISSLVVRGAPAIGCATAFGLVMAASGYSGTDPAELQARVRAAASKLASSRPTAVNLFWAIERMERVMSEAKNPDCSRVRDALEAEAMAIFREDLTACRRIGDLGARLVPEKARILTHCNAGALATAGYGTALGIIRSAVRDGKVAMVWVDETRPVLQGARLTAWEMMEDKIPATLITDSMAGSLMAAGRVDLVVVGADRIAANGDVANKIGTYSLAVLAHYHRIPFVVAAPMSTVDLSIISGGAIPIEERPLAEVAGYGNLSWAPDGIAVFNPSFDVTPANLITAIVTERGIVTPPLDQGLSGLLESG